MSQVYLHEAEIGMKLTQRKYIIITMVTHCLICCKSKEEGTNHDDGSKGAEMVDNQHIDNQQV